jgi:hypothetical protein
MNERAKIIAEQALSLPADEREELLIALAASLGRHPFERLEKEDAALSHEYRQYLKTPGTRALRAGLVSMPPSRTSSVRHAAALTTAQLPANDERPLCAYGDLTPRGRQPTPPRENLRRRSLVNGKMVNGAARGFISGPNCPKFVNQP